MQAVPILVACVFALTALTVALAVVAARRRPTEREPAPEAESLGQRAADERPHRPRETGHDPLADLSHEMRTPLTSIRALGEILRDNPDLPPAERQRMLGIIVSEAERLGRLADDVLAPARAEAEATSGRIARHDPRAILDQAIGAAGGLLAAVPDLRLETDIASDLPMVRADPDRLIQVVVNLLANAVKFSDRPGGLVRLRARADAGDLLVEVEDNGAGIAAGDFDRIFERFEQAGGAPAVRPAGSGLGLPISRRIVRALGGDIRVFSKPGEGATFSVRIPAAGHAPAHPPESREG